MNQAAHKALDRITAIKIQFDDDLTIGYVRLMNGYLKRASELLDSLGKPGKFPFFNICELAGISSTLPEDFDSALREWSVNVSRYTNWIEDVCRWHVLAVLYQEELRHAGITHPETFYEPLIEVFELGGYFRFEACYVTIGLAGIPYIRRKR